MTEDTPDIYGQVHPNETPELVAKKLVEFEQELDKLSDKNNYETAKKKCPQLLTKDFNIQFLRCEVFNADLAAKRMVSYWDKRVEIFGPEKAFQPLTQSEALKDDSAALALGFARILGTKDPSGRNIVFLDPSKLDKQKASTESTARATWYALHAALEDEDTQKRGLLLVVYPHKAKFAQFNRELMNMISGSIKGCLPVRLSGVHICHPPTFFRLIFPIIQMFLGERLRKRIRVHAGSKEKVQVELNKYGLDKDVMPSDLGGTVVLDHVSWLEERKSAGK